MRRDATLSDSDTVVFNDKNLKQLIKAFKGTIPEGRLGILRSGSRSPKEGQKQGGPTNAEIGAAHEFGTKTMHKRSFLREPIADHLQSYLEKAGAFDETKLKEVVRSGSILVWVQKVVATGEAIVMEAFGTAGFGKWPAWETPNYTNNANQILVDTQQLRNSITSEIK